MLHREPICDPRPWVLRVFGQVADGGLSALSAYKLLRVEVAMACYMLQLCALPSSRSVIYPILREEQAMMWKSRHCVPHAVAAERRAGR